MSATADADLFDRYFKHPGAASRVAGVPTTQVHIPGFTHPVREYFLEDVFEMTGHAVGRGGPYAKRKEDQAKRVKRVDVAAQAALAEKAKQRRRERVALGLEDADEDDEEDEEGEEDGGGVAAAAAEASSSPYLYAEVDGRPYFPTLHAKTSGDDGDNNLSIIRAAVAVVLAAAAANDDTASSELSAVSIPSDGELAGHFTVNVVSGGITNSLYRVSGLTTSSLLADALPETSELKGHDSVLVRVFGKSRDVMCLDRVYMILHTHTLICLIVIYFLCLVAHHQFKFVTV